METSDSKRFSLMLCKKDMQAELKILLIIIAIPCFVPPLFAVATGEVGWFLIGGILSIMSIPIWILWIKEYDNDKARRTLSAMEREALR
jgi:hypothetical protein